MKKKVLKSIGILVLAAFVGVQGSAGTVRAAEVSAAGSGEAGAADAGGEQEAVTESSGEKETGAGEEESGENGSKDAGFGAPDAGTTENPEKEETVPGTDGKEEDTAGSFEDQLPSPAPSEEDTGNGETGSDTEGSQETDEETPGTDGEGESMPDSSEGEEPGQTGDGSTGTEEETPGTDGEGESMPDSSEGGEPGQTGDGSTGTEEETPGTDGEGESMPDSSEGEEPGQTGDGSTGTGEETSGTDGEGESMPDSSEGGEPGQTGDGSTGTGEETPGTEEGGESAGKIKLDAPEVFWDGWNPSWTAVEGAQGHYAMEARLSRDGGESWEPFVGFRHNVYSAASTTYSHNYYKSNIGVRADDDNVIFMFRIAALNGYDEEKYESSEWSEWSEGKVYNRPEQQLGTTECWWDEEIPGLIHWNPVEGAAGYYAELYEAQSGRVRSYSGAYDPNYLEKNFAEYIGFYGEGTYYVRVMAYSDDIDVYANGALGKPPVFYDTTTTSDAVRDAVLEALVEAENDPAAAAASLAGKVNIAEIALAMQTSDDVFQKISQLDQIYAKQRYITVAEPVVSEGTGIDSAKVSITGAALNAADNSTIALHVNMAREEDRLKVPSNQYAKSVQLDISLMNGDRALHTLKVPVSVRISIPAGLDPQKLTIVHYTQDGKGENARFKINGDGTITFTVTHFSHFLFGEEKAQDGTDQNEGDENSSQELSDDSRDEENVQSEATSPKTGQELSAKQSWLAIICGAAMGALLIGSHIRKQTRR